MKAKVVKQAEVEVSKAQEAVAGVVMALSRRLLDSSDLQPEMLQQSLSRVVQAALRGGADIKDVAGVSLVTQEYALDHAAAGTRRKQTAVLAKINERKKITSEESTALLDALLSLPKNIKRNSDVYRQVAARMNRMGIKNPDGKDYSPRRVRTILDDARKS